MAGSATKRKLNETDIFNQGHARDVVMEPNGRINYLAAQMREAIAVI